MKKIAIFSMVCCITACLYAQNNTSPKKMSYYAGPQASIAVGDLAKTHSAGIGIHGQALRSVAPNTSVGIRATYTYLFGKKFKTEVYEPGGGNYGSNGKYKGMNDLTVGASLRQNFDERCYGGLDLGACFDFGEGDSETGGYAGGELGYLLGKALEQQLAIFLGICGDPKIQIGLRYSIRL